MRAPARLLVAAWLVGAATVPAAAQESLPRAADLERRGLYTQAADQYAALLRQRPGDLGALLGIERTLGQLERPGDVVPHARAALAANPQSGPTYGVAMRAYAAAGLIDSLRPLVERWTRVEPGEEGPYREWGLLLVQRRDRAGARAAFQLGRQRLGRPDVLAPELAQLAQLDGDFAGAAAEWAATLPRVPGYRTSALSGLAPAPAAQRAEVVQRLEAVDDATARRLVAELLVRWGDAPGAVERALARLPDDAGRAIETLRGLADQLRAQAGPEARVGLGRVLEAIADRRRPGTDQRERLDAAQAYADGGDRPSARRLLAQVAQGASADASLALGATRTLIDVLVADGEVAEAERQLARVDAALPREEARALRRRVALGWGREGDVARAAALVEADSSVEALALRAQLAVLEGRPSAAVALLKQAGPYAGTREEATRRTTLLALLQPLGEDSVPALGAAMRALLRADTAAAVAAFERLGAARAPAEGGAEARLWAGRLAEARGDRPEAERLYRAAASGDAPATAPAAELALARLLVGLGRGPEAVATLEHLIVTWPESALVPQARRLLDEARGAVPRT